MPLKKDVRMQLIWLLQELLPRLQQFRKQLEIKGDIDPEFCEELREEIIKLPAAMMDAVNDVRGPSIGAKNGEASSNHRGSAHTLPPEYNHWARLSGWSVKEAVLLAADLNPDTFQEHVELESSNGLYGWMRSALDRGLLKEPISPLDFLNWFDLLADESIVLPPKLRQAILSDRMLRQVAGVHRNPTTAQSAEAMSEIGSDTAGEGWGKNNGPIKPNSQTFSTAQKLIVYFAHEADLIDVMASEMPSIASKKAVEIADRTKQVLKKAKLSERTVERHVNEAVRTVWDAMGKTVKPRNRP